jgi:hypothetical protein
MTIERFIAEVKANSLARTNRFAVLFDPPAGVSSSDLNSILLFCDTIQLPGLNYSTVQNRTFGEFREVPYEKLFEAINMTFYVDCNMKVKTLFDNWVNVIQHPETRAFNYYSQYISDMTIEVQDTLDNTRYEVKLRECYPKTISAIQLDNANKDLMKLNVTMQYKFWLATPKAVLDDGEQIPDVWYDEYNDNFDNFQRNLNTVVAGLDDNIITGNGMTYGINELPGLVTF